MEQAIDATEREIEDARALLEEKREPGEVYDLVVRLTLSEVGIGREI